MGIDYKALPVVGLSYTDGKTTAKVASTCDVVTVLELTGHDRISAGLDKFLGRRIHKTSEFIQRFTEVEA